MNQFPFGVAIILGLGLLGTGYIIIYIMILASKE